MIVQYFCGGGGGVSLFFLMSKMSILTSWVIKVFLIIFLMKWTVSINLQNCKCSVAYYVWVSVLLVFNWRLRKGSSVCWLSESDLQTVWSNFPLKKRTNSCHSWPPTYKMTKMLPWRIMVGRYSRTATLIHESWARVW